MNHTIATRSDLELEIAAFHQPAIDRARKMIFWAGMLYPLFALAIFAMLARFAGPRILASWPFVIAFGGGLVVWGVHIALAQWAKRSPLAATGTALAVFVGYTGLLVYHGALGNPIVPAIGVFILGRGVLASLRVHRLRARAAGLSGGR